MRLFPHAGSALLWVASSALVAACVVVPAAAAQGVPPIAEKTKGLPRQDGLFPLYWDAGAGKLWLEIPRVGEEFLYVTSLPWGVGSNDIGLDRGQLGGEHVVRFERHGNKVLLVEPNVAYRAVSDNPDERRAVEEAFAQSVHWGFKVEAETEGRLLVDATEFALRDVHNVIGTLQRTRQGSFRLDLSRSAVYEPRTKVFPRNTEIEVMLTFTGDQPGGWLREVAPTPTAVTVHERHSLIALPDTGYAPRRADPRGGFFGISYQDYAAPVGAPLTQRFIARHRLRKKNPGAARSEAVEPIVYYVDRGAPEPIRTALLDGARWWNQAFEAAGYRNAFRVELLPEGADPMDVRYNVIQWVHRATRGWSYGASITDPRTGEILKGHVSLGSLRVRQDYLIAEGLASPYATGDETPSVLEAMALARIRQLAAHEVGHTLGLAHNYIASTEGRASVMDYPQPVVTLTAGGAVDFRDAYAAGIGEWDKIAIQWGYQDFPAGINAPRALDAILTEGRAQGFTFLTDQDARPAGSAHPEAHLWDNGRDVVAELQRMMTLRSAVLQRFGERAIRRGMPLATMEEVLVPVYLYHRYQVEAATKLIGGAWYTYALRGDGQEPLRPVAAADQRRALAAVLATVQPEVLALPDAVVDRLPPRPFLYPSHRELFDRETGLVFDPVTPAGDAADLVFAFLFDPERAARLVVQAARTPGALSLGEVIDRTVAATFGAPAATPYHAELRRGVERSAVERVIGLAAGAGMPQVRALAAYKLRQLAGRLRADSAAASTDEMETAFRAMLADDIARFLDRDYVPAEVIRPRQVPPGSPIGSPDREPPPAERP